MAESWNQLAKAFDDEVEKSGQLTRLDGWPPCRQRCPGVRKLQQVQSVC